MHEDLLPKGWGKYYSEEYQKSYYYNKNLGQTSWAVPQDTSDERSEQEDDMELRRRGRSLSAAGLPPAIDIDTRKKRGEGVQLPEGWREFYSQEHKRRYWYNSLLGKSSWEIPGASEATASGAAVNGGEEVKRRRNSLLDAGAPPQNKHKGAHKGAKSKLYKVKRRMATAKSYKPESTTGNSDGETENKGRLNTKLGEVKRRRASLVAAGTPPGDDVAEAEDAGDALLPSGWCEFYSQEHKRRYFYNKALAKTSWALPGASEATNPDNGIADNPAPAAEKKIQRRSVRAKRRSTLRVGGGSVPPPPPS